MRRGALAVHGRYVMLGRNTGSARASWLAAVGLCLSGPGCQQPAVGDRASGAWAAGPRIELEEAWLDLYGHPVATFTVAADDLPLSLDEVTALAPRFTLATLTTHPVDGLSEWRSELLTGVQTAPRLPTAGPWDPDAISSARQPGSETPASLVDLGGGRFRYVFAKALTTFDPDDTMRIGAWLEWAPAASVATSSTFDFRPSGGSVEARDTVLDENCSRCHGTLVKHGKRTGVRLCLTCHTWQNADPDTIDPASMSTTATTDPNPLELGRLVHRIHRGKRLPTLYQSSSSAVPAPALGGGFDLPLPFSPELSTTALVGRKFSVVGDQSQVRVFGRIVQRTDNAQAARTVATGVTLPRDLRDCAVCHDGALQGYAVTNFVSRRTCAGCHPDVWFGTTPITDQAHLAHPGGPQPDDSRCKGCHVDPALDPQGTAKLYAPIAEIHVPPPEAPRYSMPAVEIVKVANLAPGASPVVTFRIRDRVGPIGPTLGLPVPDYEPDSATSSYVPRKISSFAIKIAGPTSPDYGAGTSTWDPITSGASAGNPDPLLLTTVNGADDYAEYVYTFSTTIPGSASGTWAVGIEARRSKKIPHYVKASDRFQWPYTGETVTESAENALVYVNTATGTWTSAAGSSGAVPRRAVVEQEKCLRCHGRLELHGSARHRVEYCLMCHIPQATDWNRRPKVSGMVNLAATFDGLEERSIHLKVLIHRIHTGGREGAASLDGIEPHVVYAYGMVPQFFDEGIFPSDLRNCTLCHAGKSYLVDGGVAGGAPTVANETGTVQHAPSTAAHVAGEPHVPPIQAACTGCHATGATFAHVTSKTVAGVEICAQCHAKGPLSVDVVHGLAPPAGGVGATFSSIVQGVFVPRCATAACHSGDPSVASPRLDAEAAHAALVDVQSGQSSLKLVAPGAPEQSYLLYKLRGDAGSVGGTPATPMPPDGLLDAADLAAIDAWIANGAPND